MEDMFQVGVIANTHGIRGEVKVYPTTDDIKRFGKLKNVYLEYNGSHILMDIQGVRYQKNMVLLKFKGIDDINEVEKYKSCGLFVERKDAVPLKKGEFFIADLIGVEAVSDEGEKLGTVCDVLQTGANDVYVIRKEGSEDLLIPAIRECILDIDIEGGSMKVHLLEGLR